MNKNITVIALLFGSIFSVHAQYHNNQYSNRIYPQDYQTSYTVQPTAPIMEVQNNSTLQDNYFVMIRQIELLKINNSHMTQTEIDNEIYRLNPDMRTYCYYLFNQAISTMPSTNQKKENKQHTIQEQFCFFEEYMRAYALYPKFLASTFKQAVHYAKERKEGRPLSYFQQVKNITSKVVNQGLTGAGVGAVAGMASGQMNQRINPGVTTLVGGAVGAAGGLVQGVKDLKNAQKEIVNPLKPNVMKTENLWQRIKDYIYTSNPYLN